MVTHQLQVRCRPVKVRRSETVLPLSHTTNPTLTLTLALHSVLVNISGIGLVQYIIPVPPLYILFNTISPCTSHTGDGIGRKGRGGECLIPWVDNWCSFRCQMPFLSPTSAENKSLDLILSSTHQSLEGRDANPSYVSCLNSLCTNTYITIKW